ncbi:helix-turn-helix domain-containing protein [Phascolarctobacterium sp.]|uniref:helix-turn-helix domain-containing protein n=1 Tax=Phascolarctobacterium sp. TaxID=2049039 RepID=UPI0038670775
MTTMEYIKTHLDFISTTYKIPEYIKKSILESIFVDGIGSVCRPPDLGSIILRLPKFEKTEPDIYPAIINYCNEKNLKEVELYQKAGITRASFSKIRSMSKTGYKPSKATIIRLCLALELTIQQTQEMLETLGYHLSDASIKDKIISWCIEEGIYDIEIIASVLYDQTGDYYLY